jgi:hypothetical protein
MTEISKQLHSAARTSVWAYVSGSRADVAQLVEHSLGKGEVTSSILVIGSRA